MSDWVNWQEFADMNRPEVQREADERAAEMQGQEALMQKAISGLANTAGSQAARGTFQGTSALGSYSDVMKQRETALQNDSQANPAMRAPWERSLRQGITETENPWQSLSKRLGDVDSKYAKQNTTTQQRQAYEAQVASQKAFNKAQADKLAAARDTKSSEAAQYAAWSDAVNRDSAAHGGAGAGAYWDAAQGTGPRPVGVYTSPRAKVTQDQVYGASKKSWLPETSNSNFGYNSGYSGNNGF